MIMPPLAIHSTRAREERRGEEKTRHPRHE